MSFSIKSKQRRVRIIAVSKAGLGTPTIDGLSGDEVSITDLNVGEYQINFNKAFASADYAVSLASDTEDVAVNIKTKAAGSVIVQCRSIAGTPADAEGDFDIVIIGSDIEDRYSEEVD